MKNRSLWTVGIWGILLTGLLSLSVLVAHPDLDRQIADMTLRIESDPDNAELYLRRGELHRIHRDWAAAEADFASARKLQPELVSVDYYLGRMYMEAGRTKQAKKTLDRFLAKKPDHAKGLVARARALVALDEPLAAAADYTRGIDAFGEDGRPDPAYYIERARALAAAGAKHLALAVRGLDEGLERLGHPVTLQLYAIELEVERGRHDAALARLDEIAARSTRKETWLVRRGEILERAGRVEQARTAYRDALAAVAELPSSRRGSRAMIRLEEQARQAVERLSEEPSKPKN